MLLDKHVAKMLLANFFTSSAVGIAAILIPWVLLKELSSQFFSVIATLTIFITIAVMPWIGKGVDLFQRKNVLTSTATILGIFFTLLYITPNDGLLLSTLLLIAYVLKQLHFSIFYTARSAMAQYLVNKEYFARINSWLEIEYQLAAFTAGGLSIFLLDYVSIQTILLICGISLLIAALIFQTLPKGSTSTTTKHNNTDYKPPANSHIIIILFLSGNIPFICVMLLNIIRPIYISDILLAEPAILAYSSLFYTVGAVFGGFVSGKFLNYQRAFILLICAGIGFFLSTAMLINFTGITLFYVASAGWGLFNGLSRIASQTIIMHYIPNQFIGRFIAQAQRVVLFMRASIISVYTVLFLYIDYRYSFIFLSLVSIAGPLLFICHIYLKKRATTEQPQLMS
ncbi:MFS transporter [Zooshikella marina]|uniref:MFS transporter n=1 Tax=Zooshikella ganghwensis TaxID=202772 RepID=UPI001BAFED16|nr:MFS transporter [Zooshikella ganghwensis]MBU2707944.1 MFS transporter [Zooshikella ganghwensis]